MKQGAPLSPYRSFLAEARHNLATERATLGARAATLGALRPLLPRRLRRELARLERAIRRTVQNAHDVELARRSLDAYAERLEVAIAFSDHVARDRATRRRRLRSWFSWALGTGGVVLALVALMVVDDLSRPPPAPECRLGSGRIDDSYAPQAPSSLSEVPNHCGLSTECARQGRCNTAPDGCYAASAEDCAASWGCKLDGLCTLVEGRCTSVDAESASGPLPATGPIAGN